MGKDDKVQIPSFTDKEERVSLLKVAKIRSHFTWIEPQYSY